MELVGVRVGTPTLGAWPVNPQAKRAIWRMGRPVGLQNLLADGSEHIYGESLEGVYSCSLVGPRDSYYHAVL